MSRENVEAVRELAEMFQRREHGRALDLYDPEIEWDASPLAEAIPDIAGVYRGHDGVRAYWRRWLAAWKDLEFEIEDVRDAGDSAILLIANQRQWGRLSEIEVWVGDGAMAFTFRDGKVIRCRMYPSQASALEDFDLVD